MKKPVPVYYTTSVLLKACRSNHLKVVVGKAHIPPPPQIQLPTPTTLLGPPLLSRLTANNYNNSSNNNPNLNPCLHLFFDIKPPAYWGGPPQFSDGHLQQLLPQAWSHSPLTTLKLIFNLRHRRGKWDRQAFYTAAYWLYQYHPKTLACNVAAIAASFGTFTDLLQILYRTLQGKLPSPPVTQGIGGRTWTSRRREKILAMAKKAVERYQRDPNYRLLHDAVSDVYALCLKSDIQSLKNHRITSDDDDEPECLEITMAADFFPHINSSYDRATLLCESVAKKVFPRGGGGGESEEEEAEDDYAYRVRKRLRKEVLEPLNKALKASDHTGANKWGYAPGFKPEPCAVETYLVDVVKAGKSKIKASALLPNEIIGYLNRRKVIGYLKRRKDNDEEEEDDDDDVDGLVAAAGLQWKTMVEDIYLKQGKFKKCLVVCDVQSNNEVSVGLGLLLSQLSEEPWNGKVITFNENPRLVSIQGDDIKSKYEFMTTKLGSCEVGVDFEKVFDLILKVAVDGNLKPEQMIERVYVFTPWSRVHSRWETSDFEAMQRKFKEKGYGDVVPHIVYWNDVRAGVSVLEMPYTQPSLGFTMLSGLINNNLVKFFLDNGGDFGPEHAMEAAISGQDYQNLVIVD